MMLALQQFAQRRAANKLHHDVCGRVIVLSLAKIVNRDHVRMAQHGSRTSFTAKTRERGVVFDKLAEQDFYRYVIPDVRATSAIHHAHAAFAELRHELILAVDYVPDKR